MPINPAGWSSEEVWASLSQMAQALTKQAQAMTDQVNWQNVQREDPPICRMADRLRDFTRMNPFIFKGSNPLEDPHKFVD